MNLSHCLLIIVFGTIAVSGAGKYSVDAHWRGA